MRRLAGLLVALSKNWLRSREAMFFSLLFPVVLLLIFGSVFGGGSAQFAVYVQNNDVGPDGEPTNLSATFVDGLDDVEPLTVRRIEAERNVTRWSQTNRSADTKRVLVIPDGFADQVRAASRRARVAVIRDTVAMAGDSVNDSTRARIDRGLADVGGGNDTNATAPANVTFLSAADDESAPAVRGIVDSYVAAFNEEALGVDEPPTEVTTADLGSRDLGAVDYYLPALIGAVVLINGAITVTSTVATFGDDGTLKRLAATPLRKREWIAANVALQSVLAVVLVGEMVVVAHLVFGVTVVPGALSVALVLLGAVGFSALGLALGGFISDPDAATSLGSAIAFPLMFLSGVFWELDVMPPFLQTVAELLPLYHFHRGLRRLMVVGTTDGTLVPFASTAAMAAVFLVAAARTTDWEEFS